MRRRILGRKKETGSPYNTFIGNVADVYPTKEALCTGMNIPLNYITNFNLNGNDIEVKIITPYVLALTFSNTAITHFIETEPMVTSLVTNAFRYCMNLALVDLINPSITNAYPFASSAGAVLKKIILRETTTISSNSAFQQVVGSEIWIPKVTQLGSTVGLDNVFLTPRNSYTVFANVALQTNNGGNMDGDLQYLVSNGRTVNFVTEYTE